MDQRLLQRTRYLLQTRFRRIRTAPLGNFEVVSKQVLNWLEGHPILSAVLQHLNNVPGDHHLEIRQMLESADLNSQRYYLLTMHHHAKQEQEPAFKGYTPLNLEEHASACLDVVHATILRPDSEFYRVLAVYLTQEDYDFRTEKDPLEAIKEKAVHDLYEYLDENLDGLNAVNGILQKYKQNVEWFQRESVRKIGEDGYGNKTGERALAVHLQQYVFDQGVEFVVEPSSVSGEVDLLLRDSSGQYTLIDAKYVKPGAARSEIVNKLGKGFNQVARYCVDHNQYEGFLAVFVNDDVSILVDLEQNDNFRFLKIGGNVIYYVEINISERLSASKSGKAEQISISRNELFAEIEKVQRDSTDQASV